MGDATEVGVVCTAYFVLWAMHHRWILLPDEGSHDVAPNPVLRSSSLTALFWCAKMDLLPLFERRDVVLRK